MTLAREHYDGPYVIQCDECTETEELEGEDFSDAVRDAKDRGFVIRKGDGLLRRGAGDWLHFCKECG